jgi:tripartite-type tricarboxylate transporter receptor subunit TctC
MNIFGVWGRRAAIGTLCLVLLTPFLGLAASEWPGFAVRIVSMHPPGSVDDPIARPLAEALKKSSKYQVALQHHLIDAQPNGPEVIAGSVPNGQTVGILGNDIETSGLKPIALLASSPMVLAAHPAEPYRNFHDAVRAARQRPGQVLVGSPGPRSSGHLAIEEFNASQNVTFTAIAYKASGPLLADIISGRMALGVVPLSAALSHAKAGRIRVLGIGSTVRDARLPEARPLSDQGLEGFELKSWWAAFGAEKISDETAAQISARLLTIGREAEFIESMRLRGVDVTAQDSRSLERAIAADAARWAARQSRNSSIKER